MSLGTSKEVSLNAAQAAESLEIDDRQVDLGAGDFLDQEEKLGELKRVNQSVFYEVCVVRDVDGLVVARFYPLADSRQIL
jgi:ABC-type anion transport system duplicated permease subunit